ncbi:MAG: histidine phosphatase family protein [Nanoarchaeota archaeon]|nr:histidine phosphatase family protein [Nanoarchaeota archaeon]
MRVYITRHGKINLEVETFFCGRKNNNDLNFKGKEEAKKTGIYFKDIPLDKIITSPMKRTVQTSVIIEQENNRDINIFEDSRLIEIDFGVFDCKGNEEIFQKYKKEYEIRKENKFKFIIPEGESYEMVYERVKDFFHEIYEENNSLLLVTHGTTLKLILYFLTELSLEEIDNNYVYGNCCIFSFDLEKQGDNFISKSLLFNYLNHLK